MRTLPYSLDLSYAVKNALKAQTINTPSTINIWMCHAAAQWMNHHGGLKAMDQLCRRHADYLVNWANQTDWVRPLVQEDDLRSYTTLTLQITDPRIRAEAINQALADTKLHNLQDGIKKYSTGPDNSLRVACFPFIDVNGTEQYEKLTQTLDVIVAHLRNNS